MHLPELDSRYHERVNVVTASPLSGFTTRILVTTPKGNRACKDFPCLRVRRDLRCRLTLPQAVVSVPMKTWTPGWKSLPVMSRRNVPFVAVTAEIVGGTTGVVKVARYQRTRSRRA